VHIGATGCGELAHGLADDPIGEVDGIGGGRQVGDVTGR
jgi:hypothetical protein